MLARIHQCRILCLLRTEPGGELFFVGTSCRWCCCLFMRVPQLCLSNSKMVFIIELLINKTTICIFASPNHLSSCKLLRMWLALRVACHAVVLLAVITEAGAQFNLGVNHSKGGGARKGVAASTGGTPHLCYDSAVAERLRSGESLTFVSAGMMRSSSTLLFNTLKTILKLQTIRPL